MQTTKPHRLRELQENLRSVACLCVPTTGHQEPGDSLLPLFSVSWLTCWPSSSAAQYTSSYLTIRSCGGSSHESWILVSDSALAWKSAGCAGTAMSIAGYCQPHNTSKGPMRGCQALTSLAYIPSDQVAVEYGILTLPKLQCHSLRKQEGPCPSLRCQLSI